MISVTYGSQTEPLTRVIESSYERHREVNGPFTISFTSVEDGEGNPGHYLLHEEALIEEDGHEYRVKQLSQVGKRKTVQAIHRYFDVLNGIQKHEIFGGTKTLQEFASWLFEGTPITVDVRGITESKMIPNFGQKPGPELMQILLDTFQCERDIQPGMNLVLEKQIGPDNDEQFRYGTDVITHSYSVDTTNLKTSIKGYGGNNLVVTYTSPNAALFPHAGEAEPVRDERYLVASSLLERIKLDLNDVPEVAIEVESVKASERELGERIWLILDNIGIKMQSRILSKTDKKPAYKSTAVVGNRVPKTQTDLLTETDVKIDEKIDDVNAIVEERARQSETRWEQTNEAITANADALEKYVDERYGEVTRDMAAQWEITAENITGAVTESKDYTDSRELIIMDALEAAENRWSEDLSSIGAQVTGLDGSVSTIVDDLGTLDSDLETLRGEVVSITENYDSKFEQVSNRITIEVAGAIEYAETESGVAQANAERYADGLVKPISESLGALNAEVGELDEYIDGAFKDNLVNLSERKVIANMLKDLSLEKSGADSQYNSLHSNAFLPEDKKSALQTAKTAFDAAYSTLTSTIERVIRDGLVFPHESEEVDTAFNAYRSAYGSLYRAIEDAGSHIAEKFSSDAEGRARAFTNEEIGKVNTAIGEVSESLSTLDEYVDGAFKDGIIQTTEASAISKHINDLKAQKSDLDSRYIAVYNDPNLLESVALSEAKSAFDSAHSALIQTINTAIADGKATAAESKAVDDAFSAYQSALSDLSSKITNAGNQIAAKLAADAQFNATEYTKAELAKTNEIVGRLETSVQELDGYIDASFRDGIVQEAEAKGIRNHLNSLAVSKKSIDERYNTLVGNPKLSDSVKVSLQTAKTDFNAKYSALVSEINGAIADGKATDAEAASVDAAFTAYESAAGELSAQMEDATVSIADGLATAAREAAKGYMDEELVVIRSEATSSFNTLAGRINAKADSTTVTNLGTRTYNLEQDMNAIEGQITSTVKYTDFTGETIISKISQTASTYKISAKNIDLDGITRTAGTLEIGGANGGYFSELRFPYDRYGYAANIKAANYGGTAGLSINSTYLDLVMGERLELGTGWATNGSSGKGTYAEGYWDFSGANVTGITATAVLG